jgi:tRNA(Arg) A34 adenosine deaminase TadA
MIYNTIQYKTSEMKEQDLQHLRHLADLRDLQLPLAAYDMSNRDFRFMQMAHTEAYKSPINMQHGCVAVMNGKVIARGYNTDRCHSKDGLLKRAWCCHAEIDVMRKLFRFLHISGVSSISGIQGVSELRRHVSSLSKVTLYVARASYTDDRLPKSSGPCNSCVNMLRSMNIKNVAFVSSDNRFVKCSPRDYTIAHITSGHRCALRRNPNPANSAIHPICPIPNILTA